MENMKTFKFEAEGDAVYVEAKDKVSAQSRFEEFMGKIPASLLTVTEVDALPEGEEAL